MKQARLKTVLQEIKRVDGCIPSSNPINKHKKMALSPFQFYRGSAQLYYHDIATDTIKLPDTFLEAPLTRIMGDCHFTNFGFYSEDGSYGEKIVWGPNDFDDAVEGHAVYDVHRFCVSLFLVEDYVQGILDHRYSSDPEIHTNPSQQLKASAHKASKAFLKAYRRALHNNPKQLDAPLNQFSKKHVLREYLSKAQSRVPGGKKFTTKSTLAKLANLDEKGFTFRLGGKCKAISPELKAQIIQQFRPYVDDSILDVARRVGAGTGSLNIDRFYLLVGSSGETSQAYFERAHIVEIKQQRSAALIHYFPQLSPVNRLNPAHLTLDCQRRMVRRPDLVLDEVEWQGHHWLVRSRHHARVSLDPEDLLSVNSYSKALKDYAKACGKALARAHGRGDRRSYDFEEAMIEAIRQKGFSLIESAQAYAALVQEDFVGFQNLINPQAALTA